MPHYPKGQKGHRPIPNGDHATHLLYAAVVQLVGPGSLGCDSGSRADACFRRRGAGIRPG